MPIVASLSDRISEKVFPFDYCAVFEIFIRDILLYIYILFDIYDLRFLFVRIDPAINAHLLFMCIPNRALDKICVVLSGAISRPETIEF